MSFPKRETPVALLAACALAIGCASPGESNSSSKDREIADLKAQSGRRQEAISRAQETIAILREQIEQLGQERSKLSYELARAEGNCRTQSELATRYGAQSTATADKLAKSEEARLRLERTQLQVVQILGTVQHHIGLLASNPPSGAENLPAAGPEMGSRPRSFAQTVAWLGVQVQIARNLLQYPAEGRPELAGSLPELEPEPRVDALPPPQGPMLDGPMTAETQPQPAALTSPGTAEAPRPVTVGFWSSFASLVGGHVGSLFQKGKALTAADVTFLGAILIFTVACMWILGTPLRIFLRARKEKELGLLRRVVKTLERKEREPDGAAAPSQEASNAAEEEVAASLEEVALPAERPRPEGGRPPEVKSRSPAAPEVPPSDPSCAPRIAGHHDTQRLGDTTEDDFTQTQLLPGPIQEDMTQTQEMPKVSEDEFKNTQVIAGPAAAGDSRLAPKKEPIAAARQDSVPAGAFLDNLSRTQQMPSADEDFRATQTLPEMPLDEFASTQTIHGLTRSLVEVGANSAPAAGRRQGKDPRQGGSQQSEIPLKTVPARARQREGISAQNPASPIEELSSNKELLDELEQLMGKRPSRQK